MPYIELHARSAFSFLRAGSLPEALVAEAARLGMPALALCDRDGVYGAVRLHVSGREAGVRALVGCELTMEDDTVLPVLVASAAGLGPAAAAGQGRTRPRPPPPEPPGSRPPPGSPAPSPPPSPTHG